MRISPLEPLKEEIMELASQYTTRGGRVRWRVALEENPKIAKILGHGPEKPLLIKNLGKNYTIWRRRDAKKPKLRPPAPAPEPHQNGNGMPLQGGCKYCPECGKDLRTVNAAFDIQL